MKKKKIYSVAKTCFRSRFLLLMGTIFFLFCTSSAQKTMSVFGIKNLNLNTSGRNVAPTAFLSILPKQEHKQRNSDTLPSKIAVESARKNSPDTIWADKKSLYLYDQISKDSVSPFPAFPQFYFNLTILTVQHADSGAIIRWGADINENVRWFIIERSADKRNFSIAGEIDLSSRHRQKEFTFFDSLIIKKPRSYYHIRALLADGSSMVSEDIVFTNRSVAMRAWLQTDEISGESLLMADKPVKRIEIIDSNSKVVYKNNHIKLPFRIPYEKLKAGPFAVKVFSEEDFVMQVLIKKE